MTDLTPAQALTAAADALDVAATGVTPGPWKATPDVLVGGWTVALSDAGEEGPYLADFVREPDARYLALLHPAFGKAVAAWLRVTASEMDAAEGTEYRAVGDGHDFASWTAALAVARAILTGGDQ